MNKNNFELDIEILSNLIQNFIEISVSYTGQIIGAALEEDKKKDSEKIKDEKK